MRISIIIFALLMGSGCASYYNRIIESDYSYSGKFDKYDSFDFMTNFDAGVEGDQKSLVEKFIGQRLNTLGYHHSPKRPSIIVSYKVFYDDFEMKGYMQPNFTTWVQTNQSNAKVLKEKDLQEEEEIEEYADYFNVNREDNFVDDEEAYDELKCEMKEGSLLISFFDRRAKRTVWQGYASGVVNNINEERFLRHTVGKILDKYSVLASGFGVPN